MTNVEKTISLLKKKLSNFKENEDYSVSFKEKDRKKKEVETYLVKNQELKKELREVVSFSSSDDSLPDAGYKISNCDDEGNCFAYEAKLRIDVVSDKITFWKNENKKDLPHEEDRFKIKNEEEFPSGDYRSESFKFKPGKKGIEKIESMEGHNEPMEKSETSNQQQYQQVNPPEGKY